MALDDFPKSPVTDTLRQHCREVLPTSSDVGWHIFQPAAEDLRKYGTPLFQIDIVYCDDINRGR